MDSTRSKQRINYLYIFTFFLLLTFTGKAGSNENIVNNVIFQLQDTVVLDTTGTLPFPFKDQPAFGHSNPDSIKLFLNKPSNIKYEIEYDPVTGQYVFYEKIGALNYRLPQTMSLDDYVSYDFDKSIKDYWKERSRIQDLDNKGGLIPKLTIGGEAFNRIFGGNTIDIKPQGYVEVSFGYQMNATENPAIPERLRKVPTFDFDEKIRSIFDRAKATMLSLKY
jgi:hypothetical protein